MPFQDQGKSRGNDLRRNEQIHMFFGRFKVFFNNKNSYKKINVCMGEIWLQRLYTGF